MAIGFNKNMNSAAKGTTFGKVNFERPSRLLLGSIAFWTCLGMIGCNKGQHSDSTKMTDEKYVSQRCASNTSLDLNQYIVIRNSKLSDEDAQVVTYTEDISTTNKNRKMLEGQTAQAVDPETMQYYMQIFEAGLNKTMAPSKVGATEGANIQMDKIDCNKMTSIYRGPGAPLGMNVKITNINRSKVEFEEIPLDPNSNVKTKFKISIEYPNPVTEKKSTIDVRNRMSRGRQSIKIEILKEILNGNDKEVQKIIVKQDSLDKSVKKISVKAAVLHTLGYLLENKKRAVLSALAGDSIPLADQGNVRLLEAYELKYTDKIQTIRSYLEPKKGEEPLKAGASISVPISIFETVRLEIEDQSFGKIAALNVTVPLAAEEQDQQSQAQQNRLLEELKRIEEEGKVVDERMRIDAMSNRTPEGRAYYEEKAKTVREKRNQLIREINRELR